MVITRKIEVFVCESDKDLRRSYYEKLYDIRNIARDAANKATSMLYAIDNLIPCLDEESRKMIQYIGTKGTPSTRQNAAYTIMSYYYRDKMEGMMDVFANLAQYVTKCYQADRKSGLWKNSLRNYKSNLPIPFSAKAFKNLRFADYETCNGQTLNGCFFTLAGIPFQMKFGRDRSNNRVIVERVISGEYKMCTSSIVVDTKKTYMLLCVDIPQQEKKLDAKKALYTFLGVMNPIVCTCEVNARQAYDSGKKVYEIGTAEEFNYRRRQIQEAVHRCQVNNRYTTGGRGRKKKCQAIERWHEKENNYVDTRLHTYSRMLVDLAVKHRCSKIVLMNQTHRETEAKEENARGDNFVLRNWSYYGLKEKIEYKCKMVGIKLVEEK